MGNNNNGLPTGAGSRPCLPLSVQPIRSPTPIRMDKKAVSAFAVGRKRPNEKSDTQLSSDVKITKFNASVGRLSGENKENLRKSPVAAGVKILEDRVFQNRSVKIHKQSGATLTPTDNIEAIQKSHNDLKEMFGSNDENEPITSSTHISNGVLSMSLDYSITNLDNGKNQNADRNQEIIGDVPSTSFAPIIIEQSRTDSTIAENNENLTSNTSNNNNILSPNKQQKQQHGTTSTLTSSISTANDGAVAGSSKMNDESPTTQPNKASNKQNEGAPTEWSRYVVDGKNAKGRDVVICTICEKVYINRGCIPTHMKKEHEILNKSTAMPNAPNASNMIDDYDPRSPGPNYDEDEMLNFPKIFEQVLVEKSKRKKIYRPRVAKENRNNSTGNGNVTANESSTNRRSESVEVNQENRQPAHKMDNATITQKMEKILKEMHKILQTDLIEDKNDKNFKTLVAIVKGTSRQKKVTYDPAKDNGKQTDEYFEETLENVVFDDSLVNWYITNMFSNYELDQVAHCSAGKKGVPAYCKDCKKKLTRMIAIKKNRIFKTMQEFRKKSGRNVIVPRDLKLITTRLMTVMDDNNNLPEMAKVDKYLHDYVKALLMIVDLKEFREVVNSEDDPVRFPMRFTLDSKCVPLIRCANLIFLSLICKMSMMEQKKIKIVTFEHLRQYLGRHRESHPKAMFFASTALEESKKKEILGKLGHYLPSTDKMDSLLIDLLLRCSFEDANLVGILCDQIVSPKLVFKLLQDVKFDKEYLRSIKYYWKIFISRLGVEILKIKKRKIERGENDAGAQIIPAEIIEACDRLQIIGGFIIPLKEAFNLM